ncbi:MAG: hypothetical protein GY861_18560 [bacterium]|nr:hypothetical protein [bacterium]
MTKSDYILVPIMAIAFIWGLYSTACWWGIHATEARQPNAQFEILTFTNE